jgi:hypothetical protein
MLRSYRFPENRNIQAEMTSMMNTASQVAAAMGSEELTAAMVLTVLLNDPIGVIGEIVPQSGNKAVLQNGEPAAEAAAPIPKSNEQLPEATSEMGLSFLPELTRASAPCAPSCSPLFAGISVVQAFFGRYVQREVLAASDEKRRRPLQSSFSRASGVGKTFLAEQAAKRSAFPINDSICPAFRSSVVYDLVAFERSYQGAKPCTLTALSNSTRTAFYY